MTRSDSQQAAERAARHQRRGQSGVSAQQTLSAAQSGISDVPEQGDIADSRGAATGDVQQHQQAPTDPPAQLQSPESAPVLPGTMSEKPALPKLQLGPIVKLTATNFRIWSTQVQLHLDLYGMTACYDRNKLLDFRKHSFTCYAHVVVISNWALALFSLLCCFSCLHP